MSFTMSPSFPLSSETALSSPPAIMEELREHCAPVLLVDVESGAIVDANQASLRFYGWSRAELLTRTIFEVNTAPRAEELAAID